MLQDVFICLTALSSDIRCRGLLIHVESAEAKQSYLHLVPEFEASPTDDLHLVLLMKDIRRTLRAPQVSGTVAAKSEVEITQWTRRRPEIDVLV